MKKSNELNIKKKIYYIDQCKKKKQPNNQQDKL